MTLTLTLSNIHLFTTIEHLHSLSENGQCRNPNQASQVPSIAPNSLRKNDSHRGWVVQVSLWRGGTSFSANRGLQTEIRGNFRRKIRGQYSRGYCSVGHRQLEEKQSSPTDSCSASLQDNRIAVICSARSTGKKVEGEQVGELCPTPCNTHY